MEKINKVFLTAGVIILIAANLVTAQGITYYSTGSFSPELITSWVAEINGEDKHPANFSSGDTFVIRPRHRMVTTGEWNISGKASELWIETGGILEAKHPVTLSTDTRFFLDNGSRYIHNYTQNTDITPGIFNGINNFRSNSTVEILKWNYSQEDNIIAEFPDGINWGNLTIKWYPEIGNWSLFTSSAAIQGDFVFDIKGNQHCIILDKNGIGLTLLIGGDFIIKSGALYYCDGGIPDDNMSYILDIGGNFILDGGYFSHCNMMSPLTVNLKGEKKVFEVEDGILDATNINWVIDVFGEYKLKNNFDIGLARSFVVNVLGILDCGNYSVTGDGAFTLCRGATLKTSHTLGVNGAITVTGVKILTPESTNYVFYGESPQEIGILMPSVVNDLTIDNSSEEGVILTKTITVGRTLYMTQGKIKMLENVELTLGGNK